MVSALCAILVVCLSKKPTAENGQVRAAVLILAWCRYTAKNSYLLYDLIASTPVTYPDVKVRVPCAEPA